MTISIDWGNTNIITVEQSDCTLVSGTLYTLNVDTVLRPALNDLQDDETGIAFPTTHIHFEDVEVVGVTQAPTILILSPYSVQFTPDTQWTARLEGANTNVHDVGNGILVQNQVQVIPTNSLGLIIVEQNNAQGILFGALS